MGPTLVHARPWHEIAAKGFVEPASWTCAADALIETFERFIHRAKWLST